MSELPGAIKRFLVGRPVHSERLGHTLLPKRIALPVFASDALSSVAYAPDEILLTLSMAGMAATSISPWIAVAVAIVMITVVASYRQNVHAYPSGGGDYEVVTTNLGAKAGLGVASALLADYVLTVAVSISSGTSYVVAAIPWMQQYQVEFAVGVVILLTLLNLRGVRESGTAFAIPVYAFMFAIGLTAVCGAVEFFTGSLAQAASAQFTIVPQAQYEAGISGLAGFYLILRAFSSGSAALTGVEAISNGVPAFEKPKSKNAARTLVMLASISITMLMSIMLLARATGVLYVNNPSTDLTLNGGPIPAGYHQDPVIGQISAAVFAGVPAIFYFVTAVTGIILFLAANTAFNGFPVLGSVLAKDGYLPKQLHTRGDRLAYSNGILALAAAAIVLIIVFQANVTRLIQLYIVGVFISFTFSQLGMIRHWNRLLRVEHDPKHRRAMMRSRVINAFGFCMTGIVLFIVLITKFTHGAWVTLTMMAVLFITMNAIHRHYERVAEELAMDKKEAAQVRALPSRVHAVVLLSKLHMPSMRALSYARATRPSTLEAVTVNIDPDETAALRAEWEQMDVPVTLKVLDSPYREITRPVLNYVRSLRRDSPRDLVVVYIPEYVVGHWWEQLLHNQSALRLKSRLLFSKGVVVASVPWQLSSSSRRAPAPSTGAPKDWQAKTGESRPEGTDAAKPNSAESKKSGQ